LVSKIEGAIPEEKGIAQETANPDRKGIFEINANVFFLGVVSLLTFVNGETVFTSGPLFLKNVLGAPTATIFLPGTAALAAD